MKTLGVAIGRFQVSRLTLGHHRLLGHLRAKYDDVLIFVGDTPAFRCTRNPLDFPTRKMMIQTAYPSATVLQLPDNACDHVWSLTVDATIKCLFRNHKPKLVGGPNSFLPHYKGTLDCYELDELSPLLANEGTSSREAVKIGGPRDNEFFREGMIYASTLNYPTSLQVVDIAIRRKEGDKMSFLMGRRLHEKGLRFLGGFVDPSDESLERAAIRETHEEAGHIEIGYPQYLSSLKIDDHRYNGSDHKIKTAFFLVDFVYGPAKAGDDIDFVIWTPKEDLRAEVIQDHQPLVDILIDRLVVEEAKEAANALVRA